MYPSLSICKRFEKIVTGVALSPTRPPKKIPQFFLYLLVLSEVNFNLSYYVYEESKVELEGLVSSSKNTALGMRDERKFSFPIRILKFGIFDFVY